MPNNLTRREILLAGAATTAALATSNAFAAPTIWVPKKLRVGVIGCQGMGRGDRLNAARFGDVVALCDPDQKRLSEAMVDHPRASAFSDLRVMLEAMEGRIDFVTVSTPDHTHALATAMAMERGIHCYTQKPLTRTIPEARALAGIAKRSRVITQMGNQGTASSALRQTAAAIKAGVIGRVKEVHCWTDRAGDWWKQGVERAAQAPEPKELNWDAWLGPAPLRPYAPGYHAFAWRGWWDFGTGSLGDMGCHVMNLPFMALDLRDPISVFAESSRPEMKHNKDSFPSMSHVKYAFGERKGRAPVDLHWYDGGLKPEGVVKTDEPLPGNGALFIGENDVLFVPETYGDGAKLLSGKPMPEAAFVESPVDWEEFIAAIEGGARPMSDFVSYAAPLTETVLLGNLAIAAVGTELKWNPRRMSVQEGVDVAHLLRPVSRPGWGL